MIYSDSNPWTAHSGSELRRNSAKLMRAKSHGVKSKRPKLLRISEEMVEWSAALEQDLRKWAGVKSRPMFGLIGFYRGGEIFAALPRTRALSTPNSFIVKFDPMPPNLLHRARMDPRMASDQKLPGAQWYSFELNSAGDLRDALWWLNRAYEAAK